MKKNAMFIVFIVLSLLSIGVAAYAGITLSRVELDGQGQMVMDGMSIITLVVVLAVFLVAVVLCGFIGIRLYSTKAEQAEAANEAKTVFFSRMSHDMRTPMTAIIGLCRMAYESEDMPTIKNYLETISTSGNHLLQLVNDVLDISAIESGRLQTDTQPVDIEREVQKIIGIVVPEMDERRQELSLKVADDVPRYVKCDATHLRQVVVNLLSNAIRFTDDEGRISLSVGTLESDGDRVHLIWHVKDNGIGMDKAMADNIFRPFVMEAGSTKYEYSGTGLGLPIASQLVNVMGGTIGVNSEIGRGSDFFFDIWVDISGQEEYMMADSSAVHYAAVDLTEKHVLLFEDLATNRLIAENVLTKMGAKIDFAHNGLQGVNMYIENPEKYDMIFMDVKMPVMDGYEATRQIRASGVPGADKVPIVAMTANAFKEDAKRALASGMNAHIGKPFDVVDVERALLEVNINV